MERLQTGPRQFTSVPSPVAGPDLGNPSLHPSLVAVREDTAVNPEGEDLRPRSMHTGGLRAKRSRSTTDASAHLGAQPRIGSSSVTNGVNDVQNSSWTAAQSVDELSMPKRIDLTVSGLRRSDRIKSINLAEAEAMKWTVHVPFNTTAAKPLGVLPSSMSNVEMQH